MKNRFFFLLLSLVLVTSCVNNERKAFEKAMSEVYKAEIDTFVMCTSGFESHIYTMRFNDDLQAIKTFLCLTYKVDSIMKKDYPNHFSFPGYDYLQYSWNSDLQDVSGISSNPGTNISWHADSLTVDVHLGLKIIGEDDDVVRLGFSKHGNK
ncbi:MAG: hypothetical protein Q4D25_04435 [Bacteroidales bacterium]|nr:hypothetical protein [Bacteroidales bacterium]